MHIPVVGEARAIRVRSTQEFVVDEWRKGIRGLQVGRLLVEGRSTKARVMDPGPRIAGLCQFESDLRESMWKTTK